MLSSANDIYVEISSRKVPKPAFHFEIHFTKRERLRGRELPVTRTEGNVNDQSSGRYRGVQHAIFQLCCT